MPIDPTLLAKGLFQFPPDLLVITGGPAAGKSEVGKRIKEEFGGLVVVTPELPTEMLKAFPIPGRDYQPNPMILELLQTGIFPSQLTQEESWRQVALENSAKLVVCDRGLLDGAAYVPGGRDQLQQLVDGMDLEAISSRYAGVIHLESLSTCNPKFYDEVRNGNPSRFETLEQAVKREHATRKAWEGYRNYTFVEGGLGLEHATNTVLNIVTTFVQAEHERKFRLPAVPTIDLGSGEPIEQGYFKTESGLEMRVRKVGSVAYLCFKAEIDGTSRISRNEWDRPIPSWLFDNLWPHTEGWRLRKTRYRISHGEFLLELDVYHGPLDGLVTLECETAKAEHLDHLVLPLWAGNAVDVTEDTSYSNRQLAITKGVPPWPTTA